MKHKILFAIAAIALTVAACAKKGADAIVDAAVDVLLPSDATPVDGAVAGTPTDATELSEAVTP